MVHEEIQRQVKHLSKKFNLQNIRFHLQNVMPRRSVPCKSVIILESFYLF